MNAVRDSSLSGDFALFGRDVERDALRRGARRHGPGRVRSVGIVGGGTAGYLAALMLRTYVPDVDVTLIESESIPIIGVGEATVNSFVPFLHRSLGIDVHEFYREVRPTWKLGIRFEWGQAAPYHFNAPFDWHNGSVGLLGALAHEGSVNSMSLLSLMMDHDKVPVIRGEDGGVLSLLAGYPFGYHLENGRFVRYLQRLAARAQVRRLDRLVVDAERDASGDGIRSLLTREGERLSFDFYVDCSGFRSLLLERTLGSPFVSYASSLFTDSALAFNAPHGGVIKPYTTAKTMDSGWCWNIPMPDEDHLGYVFSSSFCSASEAERQLREQLPCAGDARLVQFRSGRHEAIWKGNVFAIGNSYAFVEPLESTGILMITKECQYLAQVVANASTADAAHRSMVNERVAADWDGLRWFLSVHYKFNGRLNTPFWRVARAETDVSGVASTIALFQERAPLRLRQGVNVHLRGQVAGFDCVMLGQGVPTSLIAAPEERRAWEGRKNVALAAVARAMTMAEALGAAADEPEWLDELVHSDRSWVARDRDWSGYAA